MPAVPYSSDSAELDVKDLGLVPYEEALQIQADLVVRRRAGEVPDQLLLMEHPHVITLGTGSHPEHVLADVATRDRLGLELQVPVARQCELTRERGVDVGADLVLRTDRAFSAAS